MQLDMAHDKSKAVKWQHNIDIFDIPNVFKIFGLLYGVHCAIHLNNKNLALYSCNGPIKRLGPRRLIGSWLIA